MSETKVKHTPGTVLVEDCTVYVLNEQGYNRWSCSVQAGGANSASPEEKRQIALKIQRCLNSHDALVEALEIIEAALYSEWIRKDGSGLHLETYLRIASRAVLGAGGGSIYIRAAKEES